MVLVGIRGRLKRLKNMKCPSLSIGFMMSITQAAEVPFGCELRPSEVIPVGILDDTGNGVGPHVSAS